MSIEAELISSLSQVEAKVRGLAQQTDRAGDRISRSLGRARDRTAGLGRAADRTGRNLARMGRQIAGGLVGIGSLTALVAMGRRRWDEYQQGITRAADATANFAARTRALGAPVGAAREAIQAAGQALGPEQGAAVAEAFVASGGAPTAAGIQRAVGVANMGLMAGIDPAFAGQATALAERAGISDQRGVADLLAGAIREHGAGAPQALAGLSRARVRTLAERSRGAMGERLQELDLQPEDFAEHRRRVAASRDAFADISPAALARRSPGDQRTDMATILHHAALRDEELRLEDLPAGLRLEAMRAARIELQLAHAPEAQRQRAGAGQSIFGDVSPLIAEIPGATAADATAPIRQLVELMLQREQRQIRRDLAMQPPVED